MNSATVNRDWTPAPPDVKPNPKHRRPYCGRELPEERVFADWARETELLEDANFHRTGHYRWWTLFLCKFFEPGHCTAKAAHAHATIEFRRIYPLEATEDAVPSYSYARQWLVYKVRPVQVLKWEEPE